MALNKENRELISRGFALTDSPEALGDAQLEAAIQVEVERHSRAMLDLRSECEQRLQGLWLLIMPCLPVGIPCKR